MSYRPQTLWVFSVLDDHVAVHLVDFDAVCIVCLLVDYHLVLILAWVRLLVAHSSYDISDTFSVRTVATRVIQSLLRPANACERLVGPRRLDIGLSRLDCLCHLLLMRVGFHGKVGRQVSLPDAVAGEKVVAVSSFNPLLEEMLVVLGALLARCSDCRRANVRLHTELGYLKVALARRFNC